MLQSSLTQFKWYELPIKGMMNLFGWVGYTSPWFKIYYTVEPNLRLETHEQQHVKQMKRDGVLTYHVKYIYYFLKNLIKLRSINKAYLNIPYEIEARRHDYSTF